MRKYAKYKDSGVEWIGVIPEGWIVSKNKFFLIPIDNRSVDGQEELLSVSEHRGVVPRKSIKNDEEVLSRAETLEGYKKVSRGQLVSNIMLTWKRGLGVSSYEGIVSPAYSVFEFVESHPKYFHYLFRTDQYIAEFKRNSTGVIESRLRMYDDTFLRLKSHIPPLPEQQKIATYLDQKTTLIDQIISGSEKKIEVLKEQRTAIINQAVTKGLNPKVKMKDSGVEWIGEIPEGWKLIKIKNTCEIVNEQISQSELNGKQVIHYSIPNVQETGIGQLEDGDDIDSSKIIINGGEILFSKLNPRKGTTCIVVKNDEYQKVCSGEFITMIPKTNLPKFHLSVVSCSTFIQYIDSQVESVTRSHQRVRPENFLSSLIPIPPLTEQQQIVSFLDQKTKEIDDLIASEKKRIELLKEYRQSLISEVVTGKIKVFNDKH